MKKVAESEFKFLAVAKAIVGMESPQYIQTILKTKQKVPTSKRYRNKIGPTAGKIFQEIIIKGVPLQIIKRGGWLNKKSIDGFNLLKGRVWNRHKMPTLKYSSFVFDLVYWLTSNSFNSNSNCPILNSYPKTLGDEVLAFLAVDLLYKANLKNILTKQASFCSSGLIWLAYLDAFINTDINPKKEYFNELVNNDRAIILEALLPQLTQKWYNIERSKKQMVKNQDMIRLGNLQKIVLDYFLTAIDENGRRDLAEFLLNAGKRIIESNSCSSDWIASLENKGSMSIRTDAKKASSSFLQIFPKLQTWAIESRTVPFFEDDYDINRHYIYLFDNFNEENIHTMNDIVQELNAFS